jgi:hypothetical protein
VYRGLLREGHTLSHGSDEADSDRPAKTEEEYRKLLTSINAIITNQVQAATADHIRLRDAVCAYLEVEQARGTTLTRVTQIVEEILRKAEQREPGEGDASASRDRDLAQQLVAWCVESRRASGKLAV